MEAIFIAMLALAAEPPPLNPRALEFVERDPVVREWALSRFDRNRDGWLTLFEAQDAVEEFKTIADENRDGRISLGEYQRGVAFVKARYRP